MSKVCPQVQLAQLGRLLRKYQETSKDHRSELAALPWEQPSKQAVAHAEDPGLAVKKIR